MRSPAAGGRVVRPSAPERIYWIYLEYFYRAWLVTRRLKRDELSMEMCD
eukprot:COSAG06_NODE_2881_length_6137_cov_2.388972_3_plen_49_part_00